jgi:serine/threonine-protein kinase ULK/ATG1
MSLTNSKRILTYKLTDQLLGRGSYSKVYLGFTMSNEKCAIKIISSIGLNNSTREKLLDEAKILKRLNHLNIIKLYDIYEDVGEIYIIMEYCENTMLKIMDMKLEEIKIKYYIKQLVDGLYYLQKKNIVHRDIKPANILLKNDIIKIADFGFARMLNDSISMMDTICGSPLYMAPEILFKTKYSSKSDLWSVGVIIYQMIYHRHPYKNSKSIIELIKKMEEDDIDFEETSISMECIDLLKDLLDLSPTRRMSWNELKNHEWFIDADIPLITVEHKKEEDIFSIDDLSVSGNSITKSINKSSYTEQIELDNNMIIDNYLDEINIKTKPINISPKKTILKPNLRDSKDIKNSFDKSSLGSTIGSASISSSLFGLFKYIKN